MPFYKIMVPTVDTVRYDFLVYSLLQAKRPVLLTGPVGTGKTSLAQKVLQRLDPKMYSLLVINMSAQVRKLITNWTSLFYGFSLECNDLSQWYKIGFRIPRFPLYLCEAWENAQPVPSTGKHAACSKHEKMRI